jgi:putative nucleotidyltransferase with HDIG domain
MPNFEALTLSSLIKTKLPPLPGSVLKISSMLQDVNVSQRAIGEAISIDPMLASRVLRLANSAVYSPRKPVTNIPAAVGAIGNRAIYEIVMMSAASDTFGQEINDSPVGREIWFHSLAVATMAGDLCVMARMRGAEEAFICGLLHDIGKLLLLKADAAYYTEVIERSKEEGGMVAIEKKVFGFDHAKLGAAAAEAWHFPGPVCDIILGHHEPARAAGGVALTCIVNIADTLAYRKHEGLDIDALLRSDAVAAFGFTADQLDEVWDNFVDRLNEFARFF